MVSSRIKILLRTSLSPYIYWCLIAKSTFNTFRKSGFFFLLLNNDVKKYLKKFYSTLISCLEKGWKKMWATLFDLPSFLKSLFYVNPQLKIYTYEDDNFLRSIQISFCCDLRVLENNAVQHSTFSKTREKYTKKF